MSIIYYLTCCFTPNEEKPVAYLDLENDEKLNRTSSTLYGEDPNQCNHHWAVYKKKFEICRKCGTKRDLVKKE